MPRLVLLRHAEAEQHSSDDRSRVLVERGRADAAATRALMISLAPDVALVSTAARTRETWQLAGPGGVEVVLDERLYEASAADLREVLGEQSAACVVLVGHNPSLERLAWELEDNDDTNRGLRPCGVGVFEVRDWTLSGARLTRWG